MAIAYVTSGAQVNSGSTTNTISINNTSGDFLLVGIADNTATEANVTGVTYNGVAMTKITSILKSAANAFYVSLWYLKAPATGTNNLVATRTTGSGDFYVIGSFYSGVDQTNPIDNSGAGYNTTTSDGSGATLTETLTTVSDNCWLASIVFSDYGGLGANTNCVERQDLNTAVCFYDTNSAQTPAGSKSLIQDTGNNAANKRRAITVAFQPTASSTTHIKSWSGVANT